MDLVECKMCGLRYNKEKFECCPGCTTTLMDADPDEIRKDRNEKSE